MSDPARSETPDIGQLVLEAPEEAWQQIKKKLKVKTRDEAADIAMRDPKAQQIVMSIIASAKQKVDETLLTDQQPDTYLTSARQSTGLSGVEI